MWRCSIAIFHSGTMVKAFQEGRDAVQDNPSIGLPHIENSTVQLLPFLLDAECRWIVCELAVEIGVCHKTVLHILHDIDGVSNIGYPMKFPRCNNGTTLQSHRPCWTSAKRKVMTFMDKSSLWTKLGLTHTNKTSNVNQWMEASWFSLSKEMHCTQCAVKVMFIVAYNIDGVILHHAVLLRQTVNAAYCCMFLHHHHLRPVLRKKQWHLVVQNSIILHDSARSHIAVAVQTSCASGNGRFWNIQHTHPIWVHVIMISSPKWKNHCEKPGTTQEMNLSML